MAMSVVMVVKLGGDGSGNGSGDIVDGSGDGCGDVGGDGDGGYHDFTLELFLQGFTHRFSDVR